MAGPIVLQATCSFVWKRVVKRLAKSSGSFRKRSGLLNWLSRAAGNSMRPVGHFAQIVTLPIRFVFNHVISGAWVPSGPWIVVWTGLAVASSLQTYNHIFVLSWRLMKLQFMNWRGKKEDISAVACELCDSFLSLLLKFDSASPEDVSCDALCPGWFDKDRCVSHCERIVKAIASSTHFPCMAAGLCPSLDTNTPRSFQALECSWSAKTGICAPKGLCRPTKRKVFTIQWFRAFFALHAFRPGARSRTHCEPHPGLARWASYQSSVARHGRALASALVNQPLCGEPGAHPLFCIRDSASIQIEARVGWYTYLALFDVVCDRLSILLVIVIGAYRSIRAIETPGGADAKQLLTFWCIVVLGYGLERHFVRVILSRLSIYYAAKLAVVIWLVLLDGSASCYHRLRALRYRIKHSTLWRKNIADAVEDTALAFSRVIATQNRDTSKEEADRTCVKRSDSIAYDSTRVSSPRRARPNSNTAHERYRTRKEKRVLHDLKVKARLAGLAKVLEVAREKGITEAYRLAFDRELGDSARAALIEYLQQQDIVFLYAHIDRAQIILTTDSESDDDALSAPSEAKIVDHDDTPISAALQLFGKAYSPTSSAETYSSSPRRRMRRLSTIEEKEQPLSQRKLSDHELLAGASASPRGSAVGQQSTVRRSSYPGIALNRAESAPTAMPPKLPHGKIYERGHSAEEHVEHHHRTHSIVVAPNHEPVHFFDKKHKSEISSVHASSSYYVVLHIVPSSRATEDLRHGDTAALVARTHFQSLRKHAFVNDELSDCTIIPKNETSDDSDDDAGIQKRGTWWKENRVWLLRWFMRQVRRVYQRWRQTALSEVLMGFFESEALVSTRSKTVRPKISFRPIWSEDLELYFAVGGSIDNDGIWHNPCCCYTSLLLQLWLAEPLRPDNLLGETTLDLAPFLHGAPERVIDLPLSDGTHDTALISLTIRLSSH